MKEKDSHKEFDGLLVERYKQGDLRAFKLLHKRWNGKMLRHAHRVLKSTVKAKDVVQEAWISIMMNVQKLENSSLFGPWAMKIVHFKSIDWIRDEKKQVESWNPPEQGPKQGTDVYKLLSEIPEKQRIILSMHYLEKMTIAEIAYTLGIPAGTVKSKLYYARQKLRSEIKKNKYYE